VEYISGGSNVPEIKEFFWKWRRHHQMHTEHSLNKGSSNVTKSREIVMQFLGVFGASVPEENVDQAGVAGDDKTAADGQFAGRGGGGGRGDGMNGFGVVPAMPMAAAAPGGLREAAKVNGPPVATSSSPRTLTGSSAKAAAGPAQRP